ncbi:MAG: hypothetical protein KF862_18260 [Chitinophagaceae bacterium]|nr:hypothetical protein [Chitinophagaceae bacterium]
MLRPPVTTINEVLLELDAIIAHCDAAASRQAYFALLYRQMTAAVAKGITGGMFEDPERMEKLDVIFARRYIDAWYCYQEKNPCSASWKVAFDAATREDLVVVQHILLGVNTHINLDLSIAAAETAPGQDIFALKKDYDMINDIIAATADEMQNRLEKIWWPMKFFIRVANNKHKAVINFSVSKARQAAWASATAMALTDGEAEKNYINGLDQSVVKVAGAVMNPGRWTGFLLKFVRWSEQKDVKRIIVLLK